MNVRFEVLGVPAPQDYEVALDLYSRIASQAADEHLSFFVIPGPPAAKARHRFMRNGRTYKDSKDASAEQRTASYMRQAVSSPFSGNVALGCVFFRPNRQRIDTDNMLKHVCDAATGVLWLDDSQVTAVLGVTELDVDNPRTIVVIGKHVSSMERGTDSVYPCVACGGPISRVGQTNLRATCSKKCAVAARGYSSLEERVSCEQCGTPFKRTTKTQRFCSISCRQASLRDVKRNARRPFSSCADCGTELTHRRGGRCRSCWSTSARKTA